MQNTNRRQLKIAGLTLLFSLSFCLVCAVIYSGQKNEFPAVSKNEHTNILVNQLAETLPIGVSDYTAERIRSFCEKNNYRFESLRVTEDIAVREGLYSFKFALGKEDHTVKIRVSNTGGVISQAVFIDNQEQKYDFDKVSSIDMTGTKILLNYGITVQQLDKIQKQLATKYPSAKSIAINKKSLVFTRDKDSGQMTAKCQLNVDEKKVSDTTITYFGVSEATVSF